MIRDIVIANFTLLCFNYQAGHLAQQSEVLMKLPIRFKVLIACLAVLCTVAACSSGPEGSSETPAEAALGNLRNDLGEDGRYIIETDIPGENITLRMAYSTEYDAESWRITDSKTLKFEVELVDGPETQQVYIEHVHVDVNIQADRAVLDGLPQDSMDDSLHSGDQPGFLITEQYPYEEVFSIEGYSDTLISGWGFVTGTYGSSELNEVRLTEDHLRDEGRATSNKFTFIYDVVIGNEEMGFHKRIIVNEFRVPLG